MILKELLTLFISIQYLDEFGSLSCKSTSSRRCLGLYVYMESIYDNAEKRQGERMWQKVMKSE